MRQQTVAAVFIKGFRNIIASSRLSSFKYSVVISTAPICSPLATRRYCFLCYVEFVTGMHHNSQCVR